MLYLLYITPRLLLGSARIVRVTYSITHTTAHPSARGSARMATAPLARLVGHVAAHELAHDAHDPTRYTVVPWRARATHHQHTL